MSLRTLVVTSVLLGILVSPVAADSWQPIGPKAGDVYGVAVHPTDSQIILLSGYLNGAPRTYRTVDGGVTYSELPIMVDRMFFDPVDVNTVYGLSTYLQKSTDAGVTWSQVSTFYPASAAVAGNDPNRVYAGELYSNRMHTSTNGGASWTPVTTFTVYAGVGAIAVSPVNSNTVYAGTYGSWDYGGEGLFKSTNAGSSWTNITPPILHGNVTSIAIDPANPLIVFCATDGGGTYSGNGVLKSIDGGATWVQAGFPDESVSEVVIDPLHANRVYAIVWSNLYVSNDAAASWTPIINDISDIDLLRADTDVLVLGSRGVLVSEDAGANFKQWGVEPVDIKALLVDRTNGSTLYATGRGLYRTTNGASSWESLGNTNFGAAVVQDPLDASVLYNGAYSNGGVAKSIDSGDTWSVSLANKYINDVAVALSNPSIVYACGLDQPSVGGVFRSVNSGGTWTNISSSINTTIEVHPSNDNIVYAGGAGGVVKSVDGGTTWATINNGLNNPASGTVLDLVIDATDPETVYCGTSHQGAYKTEDGGANWSHLTSPMTQLWAFAIDPADAHIVYAAAFPGVFVTVDDGQSWNPLGSPSSGLRDITIDPSDRNQLYTSGGGVWHYARTTTCAVPDIQSHQPEAVILSNCETGCLLTFNVGTGDDYSNAAVVALERKSGSAWLQDDQLSAPLQAPPWLLSHTFQSTDEIGDYVFRVVIRGLDGSRAVSEESTVSVVSGATAIPPISTLPLALEQNRPNPFNPSTVISFQMPVAGHARLVVYDVSGKMVAVLLDRNVDAGSNQVPWNGRGADDAQVSSGIYFYRLTTLRQTLTRKMVLLK